MILFSFWALLPLGALISILVITSLMHFHKDNSRLGKRIALPALIISGTLLFQSLSILTVPAMENRFWAYLWFFGLLLYLPAMLFYLEHLDPASCKYSGPGTVLSLDTLFFAGGITTFFMIIRDNNTSSAYPVIAPHLLWFFAYFSARIALSLRKTAAELFARTKSGQWRKKIWFLLTILFIYLPLTDVLAFMGLPIIPLGQVSFLALFISLYIGVRFRFLFHVSVRFAAETIVQTMPDPLIVCTCDGEINVVNDAFSKVFGYIREEVLGQNLFYMRSSINRTVVREIIRKEETTALERVLHDRKGNRIDVNISVSRLKDQDGAVTAYIVVLQDIRNYRKAMSDLEEQYRKTEALIEERTRELKDANEALVTEIAFRREAQNRLHHAAYHDKLTGLPNREMFTERLQLVFSKYRHRDGKPFALFFIDLDRFKVINDSMGHIAGDHVLKETAERLQKSLRDVDTIGRLGGDEFVVLLEDIAGSHDVVTAAVRILESMRVPFRISGEKRCQEVRTTASVGIVLADQRYSAHEELLRDADFALYRAKEAGKNRYAIFNEAIQADALEFVRLEGELREALEKEQLFLQYQPIVRLEQGDLTGFEALVRWKHPQRGVLPPSAFIPTAEESDLILAIDRWVLQRASMDLAAWQSICPGSEREKALSVSINISARHLSDNSLPGDVQDALQKSGLEPSSLIVEITESAIIKNIDSAKEVLLEIKKMGVGLHLDDFGEGYSSINLLNNVPFDGMKIDRAYVTGIKNNESGSRLLKTIVELGHSMEKSVIAEGIECNTEAELLKGYCCEQGQGFLFSKPLSTSQVEELLSGETAWKQWASSLPAAAADS